MSIVYFIFFFYKRVFLLKSTSFIYFYFNTQIVLQLIVNGYFEFTKKVVHHGKQQEVKIPNFIDAEEAIKLISCLHCPQTIKKQQELSIQIKCKHARYILLNSNFCFIVFSVKNSDKVVKMATNKGVKKSVDSMLPHLKPNLLGNMNLEWKMTMLQYFIK